MKELRVYVVNMEDFEGEFQNLSDEEVMNIAEESGSVYSLKGFENAFNSCDSENYARFIELNADYSYIRFIEVEVWDELGRFKYH